MTSGLIEKCLKNGIRMTSQRQIILGVIEGSEDHPDVDQLYRRAVEQDRTISIATVYRTVKLLEEAGVIDRLEFGDGRARYEESGEHHEHLVDVETGEVIEFLADDPASPLDMSHFCEAEGHQLARSDSVESYFVYHIIKGTMD